MSDKKPIFRTKRVGLLGGSFDPPTLGHIQLAEYVLSKTDLDQVWLVPCRTHQFDKKMALAYHRLNMCLEAASHNDSICVTDEEIRNDLDGSTYTLIKSISSWPLHEGLCFSFIIGQDNAIVFDQWQKADELKKMVRFIVVPRAGYGLPSRKYWYMKDPHIFLKDNGNYPVMDISSTQVREMLYEGNLENIETMVASGVLRYIQENKLYHER